MPKTIELSHLDIQIAILRYIAQESDVNPDDVTDLSFDATTDGRIRLQGRVKYDDTGHPLPNL